MTAKAITFVCIRELFEIAPPMTKLESKQKIDQSNARVKKGKTMELSYSIESGEKELFM
jgi:hypothetical protein